MKGPKHEKPPIVKRNGTWFLFRNRQDARIWPWCEAYGGTVAECCERYRTRRNTVAYWACRRAA